mgnify:CR=1 FL=1
MKNLFTHYRGSYISYVTLYFFAYFTLAIFSSVLPVYLTDIGKSAGEMSFIMSSSSFFSLVAVPVMGYPCDRTQRPRLISSFLSAGMAIGSLALAASHKTWTLFLLQGLTMSFFSATQTVSEQLAAGSPYRYGVLRVWGTLGYAAGAQASGLAVQVFPGPTLFFMAAASSALTVLGFSSAGGKEIPVPLTGKSDKEDLSSLSAPRHAGCPDSKLSHTCKRIKRTESPLPSVTSFLRDPRFLLYMFITFLVMGCAAVNNTYLPLLLKSFDVPTGAIGTALSVGTLVEIPVILFSHKFMDRFSSKTLLLTTMVIFAVQYTFYCTASGPWAVIIPLVLLKAIATTLMMMLNLKVVHNLVSPGLSTVALSIVSACTGLGSIILQNAGGAFADHFPIRALYLALTGFALLSLLLSLFLRIEDREKVFG